MLNMLNLRPYKRQTISDFLQISMQSSAAGYPLPCILVEQLVEAHNNLLSSNSAPNTIVHSARNKIRGKRGGSRKPFYKRLECGSAVCVDCYNKVL